MGYYIQTKTPFAKVNVLVNEFGGAQVSLPTSFEGVPKEKALICVVVNSSFEAAALIYSRGEYDEFTQLDDTRPKSWVLMDRDKAHELSGFFGAN